MKGNDGTYWDLRFLARPGEVLRPGEYFYAKRAIANLYGRSAGMEFTGEGRGCNEINGYFVIRQIQFDAQGKLVRLEASMVQYCDYNYVPLAVSVIHNAPQLHFNITAPEFGLANRTYYGDTTLFTLATPTPNTFQYVSSGEKAIWTMNLTAPIGQAQFAKGMYLTEPTARTGVAGMDIAVWDTRRAEYGKFEILTITYRNGQIVQLSARWWFYSDAARTQVLRSGRINFWK